MRPRLFALVTTISLAAGCASVGGWPRVIAVEDARATPVLRGEWIGSYDEALVSIAAVMTDQLGLPPLDASMLFYPDRDAFRAALEATGYTPDFARETAATLSAVSGHRRVIINDRAMEDVGWLFRVALLAHELTHTLQYTFANGARGTSDQWLREGFAEWVEVEVLVRLGFTTRPQAQRVLLNRLREARVERLPELSQMVTFPDWVALAQQVSQETLYGHAMLATAFLLDRHGLQAAIRYFEMFATSDDREANFTRAFGQDLPAFEAEFSARLAQMLR